MLAGRATHDGIALRASRIAIGAFCHDSSFAFNPATAAASVAAVQARGLRAVLAGRAAALRLPGEDSLP